MQSDVMTAYWLPPVEDWAARISAIERMETGPEAWDALVRLAGTRLDFVRAGRLDRALLRLFGEAPPPGLATRPVRLALLGSATTAHLVSAIRIAALRRGLWVTIHEADYGQYRQALADPGSTLHAFAPDAVLLALDARHLTAAADPALDGDGAAALLSRTLNDVRGLWRQARQVCGGQIIQQTLLPILPDLMGSNEHRLPGSPAAILAGINAGLRGLAAEEGVDLLAIDARAARDGIDRWHDPALWHRAKQEVSPSASTVYGEMVARLVAANQGRSAKCLVLDLDNTLWGGVIGDDGLDGIVIGQGSALGEAFAAFQGYAKALRHRGVILAACSKNDEANALAAFDTHPDMVLRRGDMAAIVANWTDKATNLREIATRLNIGLDALVFVDDNPFERNLVRRELPMVAVPELPAEPSAFVRCLADAGYFEALSISGEDRRRTALYQANREREAHRADATDMDAYLRSLGMTLAWGPIDRLSLQRATQLINKTNQFNLTTRRYAEEEIAALAADPGGFTAQLRLTDDFGDNGIIAVVIGRGAEDATIEIDSWLMSCRVLGRRVEEATLSVILSEAARLGAKRIVGRFMPTAKNAMVADLYPRLGFAADADDGDGQRFIRDVTAHVGDLPMAIVRQ